MANAKPVDGLGLHARSRLTKRRAKGEDVQAFEKLLGVEVDKDGVPTSNDKPTPKPKHTTHRPNEVVLWEAPDP